MQRRFQRIAIVNRGEPAVRLIRAVKELNNGSSEPLVTIALYTESDSRALFVREADEAYGLGSATFVDGSGNRKNRYLDYAALERALRESAAEAVWVGWGFVSEHPDFVDLCSRLGVVFIGPDAEVMRKLGDKIGSKRIAEEAGVPVAPWSGGAVADVAAARAQAERLGYPLMVKATAGGGGRGIRRVMDASQLEDAFASAVSEALKGFGDGTVFLEKLMGAARHIEVQIIGDEHGTVWALGVRDCSIQRRNQKVVEESPSPVLTATQHEEICAAARRLGELAGYRGAGTVEFLYDPGSGVFSFMEVNARLQVEHPVTEMTTGLDLVKLQIAVAQGQALEGEPPVPAGHAVEVRVNAEDPEQGFAPTPGTVTLFQLPGGSGVRTDSGFVEGDEIAPEFDSMLAKVIAVGRDREEALARLRRALMEMRIGIRGGCSNKGFLMGLLGRREVIDGDYDIGWLDRLTPSGAHLVRDHAEIGLLFAAVRAYFAEFELEKRRFYTTAARGRMQLRNEVAYDFELGYGGITYPCRVQSLGPRSLRVTVDGQAFDIDYDAFGECQAQLTVGGRRYQALALQDGQQQLVEINGYPHRFSRDDAGLVRAPAPAVVVGFDCEPGQHLSRGDKLVTLEAMKTEMAVVAPCDGRVRELIAVPNIQVDAGAPLLILEPESGASAAEIGERLEFAPLAGAVPDAAPSDWATVVAQLTRLGLGFDIDPGEADALLRSYKALDAADFTPEQRAAEDRLLELFADVAELFGHRGDVPGDKSGEARTAEEYLLLYLRSLDTQSAGVSERFADALRRTLGHYGVTDLTRTPDLENAMLFICKAHQRMPTQVRVVLALLERRLDLARDASRDSPGEFQVLLGRIVMATRRSYPALSDLAREVRYRLYYWPFFAGILEASQTAIRECLDALSTGHDDEAALMAQLVETPRPLMGQFTRRSAAADPALREIMLEALNRRHYRERELQHCRRGTRDGLSYSHCCYTDNEGRAVQLFSAFSAAADLAETLRQLDALAAEAGGDDVLFDCFVSRADSADGNAAVVEDVAAQVNSAALRPGIRAVVIGVEDPGDRLGARNSQYFTFRPGDAGFEEDRLYRGLHPIMGERLELWRLQNFAIERLPSTDGVFLFRGVAKSNPKDERLFAFAEIRDLTPLRDEAGGPDRFPHLEMMAMEVLAAIRVFQSHRSARQRLQWNRIYFYVWPPIEFAPLQISEAAHRLGEVIEDLGLEKVVVRGRVRRDDGELHDTIIEALTPGGQEVVLNYHPPTDAPLEPLDEYARTVVRLRQRGLLYPYEIVRILTAAEPGHAGSFPPGHFTEYDIDEDGELREVQRAPGLNSCGLVVGRLVHFTNKYPEGVQRIALMGDPSHGMGSLAEPECRRICAALDLAARESLPVEWFSLSAGALIAMDSGTENLDWTALVIRRIVEFTQAGGEINVIVHGFNVGAQSYWNAEATMLMHTRGILVMTPEGSMLLTGKRALDYSGAVSAEDNLGIGGYDRIMGVNGQAQYWAADVWEACELVLRYYDHSYVVPGERFPRRAVSDDPVDRDVCPVPHGRDGKYAFDTVGEIFRDATNPARNKPFDIRKVMAAVSDRGSRPLERWQDFREAETAVVWDAHLGGYPVCLLGVESHPIDRLGFVPMDGPSNWSSGTLFPLSSKKVARAINSASGNRPVVVLANLSGFDGSPESMRRLQLEYGAEIGRAVVNFRGPMVFCGISRYHGGAYVVFSRSLNENLEIAALEGSFASVIGGKPAAAVVFASEVRRRTLQDSRLQELDQAMRDADEAGRTRLHARWHELHEAIYSEKLGEVAREFDQIHSVYRARDVGSLHQIVAPEKLRPYLIDAVERGIQRTLSRMPS